MNNTRVIVAFLVAPLAVPLLGILLVVLATRPPADEFGTVVASIILIYLPFSYIAAVIVGMPLYRFLCARNLTAFWMAPAAGFVVGAVLNILVSLALASLGINLITGVAKLVAYLVTGGLYGLTVGVLLWLIARPDRQARSVEIAQ